MYFQDVYSLESHLNNDWPTILKNLKQREDSLLELLQYNKEIISRQRDDDDELFVNDQINQHQQEASKISALNLKMEEEEKEILSKYEGNVVQQDQISKLMGRVGARVLQTCESSLDKCKFFDKELIDKYYKMKTVLVKHINQKDNIDLEEIMIVVIIYSKEKLLEELGKLHKLIKGLQNGQLDRLSDIYTPKPQISIIEKKKEKSIERPRPSLSKDKTLQKEELKKQQKVRKLKQKLVTKMITGLYSTMDLSRAQLHDDICGNHKQKNQQLYIEIFSRNKFNHQQIREFQAKEESFHQKVKIFKEMMERESKRLAEVLIKKPLVKISSNGEQGSVINLGKNDFQNDEYSQDSPMSEKRITANRYRINSPRGRRQFRDLSAMYVSAVQSTQENFNHFKFDTSNNETFARSNRNRLPQLPSFKNPVRGSSLDRRIDSRNNKGEQNIGSNRDSNNMEDNSISPEKSKQRRQIEDKHNVHRARMVLKNIEVGVQGVLRKVEPTVHNHDKKKMQPNPMEYTFYVRKSGQKFFEPKHNIIV